MKYAARRIWPEKSHAWEYLGEAEAIEDFALMFATDKSLAMNDEFVVIEKAGADSEIEFYKVSRAQPYAVMPAAPRVESGTAPVAPVAAMGGAVAATAEEPLPNGGHSMGEVWGSFYRNIYFFVRVGATAFGAFLLFIFLAKWLFDAW